MKKQLKQQRAIIKSLKKLKNKNSIKKVDATKFFEYAKFYSKNSEIFVKMQMLHKKREPWSTAEKNFALSLYYKSPSTYRYMVKNGIVLAGESTVRRWLNSICFSTGFSDKYMEQIKLKTSRMSYVEKKCVILLDEISIMKCVEYNKILDLIEGFEDVGTLGRTNKIGSHALVVMLRGLYSNWKFPFCYFFTGSGVKGDDLVLIIKNCVQKVLDLELIPTCIVCDQGTQNRRMFSILKGTEDNPHTTICGQKLFLIYDLPHLIKSLRNNLLNGNYIIEKTKLVTLKDIRKTYEIDIKNKARAMCKITPTHLAPNPFQKMTCKLAIQLLSHSVSAAIRTCITTGELKSPTAIDTANFIDIVNNMFDSGNSKHLYDPNPNKRPMSDRNPQVLLNLEKARQLFKSAVKICHKTNKSTIPPCITGIIWTTTAISQLYESEKIDNMKNNETGKGFFLMTNRLTQDALENMFSIIRQKNGNCEPDNDDYITALNDVEVHTTPELEDIAHELPETTELSSTSNTTASLNISRSPLIPQVTTPETCSITYFSGYLVKKSQGLKAPSNVIIKITTICLNTFEEHFDQIKSEYKIMTQLKEKVIQQINFLNIFNSIPSSCQEHYIYIIELLLRTKIFKECKWENEKLTGRRQTQTVAKLRVLQNK
ncbi:hypothetical protein QTP88_025897 [Uroleucon formosanum]